MPKCKLQKYYYNTTRKQTKQQWWTKRLVVIFCNRRKTSIRWWQVERFIIVLCNSIKTSTRRLGSCRHLQQCKKKNKRRWQVLLVIVFWLSFVRRPEDDNKHYIRHCCLPEFDKDIEDDDKCNACSCLLCKGTKTRKKKKERKRVDVHLLAIELMLSFEVASSTISLQQRLLL